MEELRSTEVLDKEIETDARKKAERILAKADSDGKALVADVARRVASFHCKRGDAVPNAKGALIGKRFRRHAEPVQPPRHDPERAQAALCRPFRQRRINR